MTIKYYKTEIYDCYLIKRKDIKDIIKKVIIERRKNNYPVTRTQECYERELKAHILLYKLHLFRKHTEDCDLEEHIKKWKKVVYFLIGW